MCAVKRPNHTELLHAVLWTLVQAVSVLAILACLLTLVFWAIGVDVGVFVYLFEALVAGLVALLLAILGVRITRRAGSPDKPDSE